MSERARVREEQRNAELQAALRPAPEAHARPEAVVIKLRRHGRVLTLPAIMVLASAFAAGFFIGTFPELWQNLLAIVAAVLILIIGALVPLTIWLGNTSTITTRRIIVRSGFLTRTRSEVPLSRVREIRTRASIWQRPFKAGTIELLVGSEQPIEIKDAPAVASVVDMLHELLDRTFSNEQGTQANMTGSAFGATGQFAATSVLPSETRAFDTSEGL